MTSAAAASPARRLASIFSSATPRAQPLKTAPAPGPVPAPKAKAAAGDAEAKSNGGRGNLGKPLTKIVRNIFRERDPDKLVSQFIAASSASQRFRHKHRVYEVSVARLVSFGRHDAITTIIDSQKPFLEASGEGFAACLVRLYGRAGMPSHAAATFHDLPPKLKSVKTFDALLAAYVDAGELDALDTAFRQIPASHPTIVPNIYSYNILISALCQKPDLSAALDVIPLMEKCGIKPDVISFNILLNGFYNNGRFDDAEKVWEMMKERNVEPYTRSYNAKVRGLVSEGRMQDAAALVEKMQKDGPKPDTVSYNELIRGYCKEGRLDAAKKAGELDRALSCCHEIFSRKLKAECSVLQGVVTALVSASRVEEAKRIVDLGRMNYYPRKDLKMPPGNGEDNDAKTENDLEDHEPDGEGREEEEESKNAC
nr:unnamed protein product [Digitaria exilis]